MVEMENVFYASASFSLLWLAYYKYHEYKIMRNVYYLNVTNSVVNVVSRLGRLFRHYLPEIRLHNRGISPQYPIIPLEGRPQNIVRTLPPTAGANAVNPSRRTGTGINATNPQTSAAGATATTGTTAQAPAPREPQMRMEVELEPIFSTLDGNNGNLRRRRNRVQSFDIDPQDIFNLLLGSATNSANLTTLTGATNSAAANSTATNSRPRSNL
jgi:hypothetical protein